MDERHEHASLAHDHRLGRVDPRRVAPFVLVVVLAKLLRVIGLFSSYDLLQVIPVAQFLFVVHLGAACVFIPVQRPMSSGKRIQPHMWPRIVRNAVVHSVISLLFTIGLTLCGPLRTSLIFDHSDLAVLAMAAVLWGSGVGVASASKIRGCLLFILGVICLLLFDFDTHSADEAEHPEGSHHGSITHLLYWAFNHLGLPDHKGGVLLMLVALLMAVTRRSAARKLAVELGGANKLHALTMAVSAVILFPWAIVQFFAEHPLAPPVPWLSCAIPLTVVILTMHVLHFYMSSVSSRHLQTSQFARLSSGAAFTSALLAASFWNTHGAASNGYFFWLTFLPQVTTSHALSGGVLFSYLFFMLSLRLLTRPTTRGHDEQVVGYTPGGLPLYGIWSGSRIPRHGQSLMAAARGILRQVLEGFESRQIFYYLCLNLLFTAVELLYGMWTNSLGLISDGFHMLFDCTALVVGLYAAIVTRWQPTRMFSYGYGRVEVLSGFANGLFLLMIAAVIFVEALARLVDPPDINTDRLLVVSVAGFLVNMVGIFAFSHAHSHGGEACSGHGHQSHGHSHHGHGHSHGVRPGADSTQRNANMQGVFLHVLADTLGSVGVIISSLLVQQFGWLIADPICSLLIACLISLSVMPLLKQSALTLVQGVTPQQREDIGSALQKIKAIPGVMRYREAHFWKHSGSLICSTLHVHVSDDVAEQKVAQHVTAVLKEHGFSNTAIQIEKEAFFRLAPAHITRSFCTPGGSDSMSAQVYVTYGPQAGAGGYGDTVLTVVDEEIRPEGQVSDL